jgi:hypothetical protein
MNNPRLRDRLASLFVLTLCLAAGGSRAKADLTLMLADTITDPSTQAVTTVASIAIDSSTGSATFTSNATGLFTFNINNTAVSFNVTTAGQGVLGSFAANASDDKVDFTATGISGTSSFGNYNINSLSVSQFASPTVSEIDDVTTDIGGANVGANEALTIAPGYSFNGPNSPTVSLESDLSPSKVGSGQVTFLSTLGTTSTASLTATGLSSQSSSVTFAPGTPPYNVSNQLVISGLTSGLRDNISATTDVNGIASLDVTAPEPSTITMALIALPGVLLAAYRRRKATAAR